MYFSSSILLVFALIPSVLEYRICKLYSDGLHIRSFYKDWIIFSKHIKWVIHHSIKTGIWGISYSNGYIYHTTLLALVCFSNILAIDSNMLAIHSISFDRYISQAIKGLYITFLKISYLSALAKNIFHQIFPPPLVDIFTNLSLNTLYTTHHSFSTDRCCL